MFRFIKKLFFTAMMFFIFNTLKYVSMSNQEYKVRPVIMNINSNDPLFCLYILPVNKYSGGYNVINNSYAKLCVPDVTKNMNIKVLNQI